MLEDSKALIHPKDERAEIDTSLPFASVKAAVSLFGEKVDSQKPKVQEVMPFIIILMMNFFSTEMCSSTFWINWYRNELRRMLMYSMNW